MGDKISVLIADDNYEFAHILSEYINNMDDMKTVAIAKDGIEAIDKIQEFVPDVVVLDVIMPNLDGIGVLERIKDCELISRPLFIMLSAIGQDMFIQKSISLGAEYYIVKPFDVTVLISRIRQICSEKRKTLFSNNMSEFIQAPQPTLAQIEEERKESEFDLQVEVTNLLREAGIPPHMAGYQYLREAIIQTVNNPKIFSSITKVLYPAVAERFTTSPQKVERAIRNSIESAWARRNQDSVDSLFGYTINYSKGKPTNSEFIAMMADKLKFSIGYNKNI